WTKGVASPFTRPAVGRAEFRLIHRRCSGLEEGVESWKSDRKLNALTTMWSGGPKRILAIPACYRWLSLICRLTKADFDDFTELQHQLARIGFVPPLTRPVIA